MDDIPPEVPGYRLTALLGTGATSRVWRARREADDELVAVKVLSGVAGEEAVREFTLLQQAAGDHVVTLHEVLALEGPEGPATALVLELLSGGACVRSSQRAATSHRGRRSRSSRPSPGPSADCTTWASSTGTSAPATSCSPPPGGPR
ncbi:hypothetical protein [Janibacter sp. DB-40]|uniref:hypothetical protein n=1 Tax=Janibacter sp. DB-40 TaxID=3028808 RepID=UPI0024050C65|nr:hypothetical protein [Janibacter sp. DB-40]